MAKSSYSTFRNANNNLFTVSGPSGYAHQTDKYWTDGMIQVAVSRLSVTLANAVIIKNFPYKFKIYDVTFANYAGSGTKAGAEIEIYNGTTSNATQYVCGVSCQVSRSFKRPALLNFNKTTVDKTDQLLVLTTTMADASAALQTGLLTLWVRPV